ncbi:MAG TPA: crosslink repair DNA glycosylase YcaQ family protein [Chloroflexota bacterium]
MRISLSADEARGLALRAQRFASDRAAPTEPIDLLDQLGAIQIDSVNVLARNHLLIPYSRLGPYSVPELHQAIYGRRRGFEYWGHMASWLSMSDFRYFLPRMQRMRAESRGWWTRIRAEHAALYPVIMERIRAEGALGAVAFDDPRRGLTPAWEPQDPRGGRGTWWDWKPAKLVLEDLLDQGELMCTARTAGFARIYDLPERVLPESLDTSDPGDEAATRYLLMRGLACLGVATTNEIIDYYRLKPPLPRGVLKQMLADGEIVEVEVEGWQAPALSTPAALEGPLEIPEHPPALLAPFDNLMWERARVERIFGFRYRVEIYVPEPKRQYGYYVLPLLVRGGLRGRADLKLNRQVGVLQVRGLWLEGADPAEAQSALETLARHLGASDIDSGS